MQTKNPKLTYIKLKLFHSSHDCIDAREGARFIMHAPLHIGIYFFTLINKLEASLTN